MFLICSHKKSSWFWLASVTPKKRKKKGDILISYIQGLFHFFFVIDTLFILLHDHFISDLWFRRTKLYSVLFPLRQKYIHWLFLKYVYEVVRSLKHWKELLESFRGYFNRKKFVVSLTPESRSDVSHTGIFCSSLFFHFCARRIIVYCFLWRKNRTFLSSFHGKCCI